MISLVMIVSKTHRARKTIAHGTRSILSQIEHWQSEARAQMRAVIKMKNRRSLIPVKRGSVNWGINLRIRLNMMKFSEV